MIKYENMEAVPYTWFARKCLQYKTVGVKAIFQDGNLVICKYTKTDALLIVITADMLFSSNPRKFGINDGYIRIDDQLVKIGDGLLEYPLVVDTTAVLTRDKDANIKLNRNKKEHGNIDWIGKNTSQNSQKSNAPILTWKGPVGRSVPFDYNYPIYGLTSEDISFTEGVYYTCFSPFIYQNGEILHKVIKVGDIEPKVLGAAYSTYTINEEDITALVCVVNNHYPNQSGFFDEVWITHGNTELYNEQNNPDGWRMLAQYQSARPTQCWFFNESGNKCTQGNIELDIDLVRKLVNVVEYESGSGSYSAILNGVTDLMTIVHNGTYNLYSDYLGDERVVAKIVVQDNVSRQLQVEKTENTTNENVYVSGSQTTSPYTLTRNGGGTLLSVGSVFTLSGGKTPSCGSRTVTWSGSGCTVVNGQITATTCVLSGVTAYGSVTATITGEESGTATFTGTLPQTAVSIVHDPTYAYSCVGTGFSWSCGTSVTYAQCIAETTSSRIVTDWRYGYGTGCTPASGSSAGPPGYNTNCCGNNCCQNVSADGSYIIPQKNQLTEYVCP